ncbi:MAG: hypothetical protein AAF525_11225 [Pseudomonadota bacterium]
MKNLLRTKTVKSEIQSFISSSALLHQVISLGLACLVLVSCGGSGPTGPRVVYLERSAMDAVRLGDASLAWESMDEALRHFERQDDLAGQWRMRLLRTRYAFDTGDERIRQEIDALTEVSKQLGSDTARYENAILVGRVSGDVMHFETALQHATTPIQRAVALTYLNRYEDAAEIINRSPPGQAGDIAFVTYHVAVHEQSASRFREARAAYVQAGNPRGTADCLFQLARLARADGEDETAASFANRAIRALSSAGFDREANVVRAWLSTP